MSGVMRVSITAKFDDKSMNDQNTAWIDLVSPSHPFFFASLAKHIDKSDVKTTVRKKTETVDLAEEVDFDFEVVGRDFSQKWLKIAGIPARTAQLAFQAPDADIALCSRNAMCILAAKARNVPSINFTDNDITAHQDGVKYEERYNQLESLATYNIVPSAFETGELTKWHADRDDIFTYEGYKEDVYVADFEPDPRFLDRLPFETYIVLRPEALDATYVDSENSLVPDLLEKSIENGHNVVYLPRGRGDEHYAVEYSQNQVFVPQNALDGLQLAWHSNGVLTGSGTMAREAASMSIPAVSFFPNKLLSVDRSMVEQGRVLHSRDTIEIMNYIDSVGQEATQADLNRSKQVKDEVVDIVNKIINKHE
ncbi:hypothetical protein SAMN04487949_2881 [Halogranum gelatinilyticum]|uniref:DUF354 domain-containing protein n=1 Tax=Halogranum gelatinilyticum TaxID=660521 RepID=A0A1G9X9I2_9EURY|nr:DUF354 domain-containing protein [Halogranum gelatinilyticum]SDM92975.1 hypothetical protein SAMN04487949_2881 [Halogranum gelatinilyticum]